MKWIVVLRHANESGTTLGAAKKAMIARAVQELLLIRSGRVRVFCSTHPNAVEAAREFGFGLDAEPEPNDAVSKIDGRSGEAFDALVSTTGDADLALVVTHKVDVAAAFAHLSQQHGFRLVGSGPFPAAPLQGYYANVDDREIRFVAHEG